MLVCGYKDSKNYNIRLCPRRMEIDLQKSLGVICEHLLKVLRNY